MKLNLGNQIIIWITGDTPNYIAEIIQEDPLYLKVEEEGPYARLKPGDYIIREGLTEIWQANNEKTQQMLTKAVNACTPFLSGLHALNVADGKLHHILPAMAIDNNHDEPTL